MNEYQKKTDSATSYAHTAHILMRESYRPSLILFLLAACAAALLTACPPEAKTTAAKAAPPQLAISYCGVDGITSLTLVLPPATQPAPPPPQKLTSNLAASWSSSDPTTAEVAADGAIILKQATAANTPVLISAAGSGQAASFELSVLAAGTTPSITVKSEADLRLMGCADGVSRLGATYTLANDITLSKEWEPIGDSNNAFTGTLDGAGHTIKNLFIDKPNMSNVGLVAVNDTNGKIKNIGVEVAAAGIMGSASVGGLVGENNGGSVSGVVRGAGAITARSTAPSGTGGLAGYNSGTVIGYASVTVNSIAGQAGGLVGYNGGSGSVTGYAEGNVTSPNTYVGGLVGNNTFGKSVIGYYVTGTVQGQGIVGGLVGIVTGALTGYVRGAISVSSNTSVGRVVGNADANATVNAYYSGKAGESEFTAPAGGTSNNSDKGSITITAATKATDFAGFDFTSNDPDWEFISGKWPAIKFPAGEKIFDDYRGTKQPIDP